MRAASTSLFALLALAAVAADPADEVGPPLLKIDPTGLPEEVSEKPKGPGYLIWHAEGAWHLRVKTMEEAHNFGGTVRVRDGQLKLAEVAGLEGRRKRPGAKDAIRTRGRSGVDFLFRTKGRTDGFDFEVIGDEAVVEFDLKVDGSEAPKRVRIGKQGAAPPAGKFLLPGHPAEAEK